MTRTLGVDRRAPEHQPSQRLKELSPEYAVAAEALQIAADHGCDWKLYEALFALCQRTADAFEAGRAA